MKAFILTYCCNLGLRKGVIFILWDISQPFLFFEKHILRIPCSLLYYFIKTYPFLLSRHTHTSLVLVGEFLCFHRCFTWVPSADLYYTMIILPTVTYLVLTLNNQRHPWALIHLCHFMVCIWDQLFVAFEASQWADGTWDRVCSHEFMMCFISPAPPCCWAQTAADVIECTFVNIYPGWEPMKLREVHKSMAMLTEQQILASESACVFSLRGRVEKELQ